jgi:uncharacterized protein DUF2865
VFAIGLRKGRTACAATILAAGGLLAGAIGDAHAQGLFDFLFGRGHRPSAPSVSSFADPSDMAPGERRGASGPGGPSVSYCVRLCDGRHFPMQRNSGTSAAEICQSLCPAAKTKVFSGGSIDGAWAQDGTRYASLANAFVYRERFVPNCSCNGKPQGLARIDVKSDPTLRPGDIVATSEGMMSVTGGRRGTAEFTPVDRAAVSAEMRRKLSDLKIAPPPASGESDIVAAPDSPRPDGKRNQATR